MAVVIYIICLGGAFLFNYKKWGFNASSFLIFIYFLSSFTAGILLLFYDFYDPDQILWYAVVFHLICLYLFLSPVVNVINRYSHSFNFTANQGVRLFSWLSIGFGMLAIISAASKFKTILSFDSLSLARTMYNRGELHDGGSGGLIEYFGTIGGMFSYVAMFLFFYYLVFFPKRKLLIVLLLIASFADPLYSLSAVGRGGIIRWAFLFIFFFLFFKNQLSRKAKRMIIKTTLIFCGPLFLIFLLITLSRFGDRDNPVIYFILSYLGQSFIYFSYNFDLFFNDTFGGRMNFPIFFPDSQRINVQLNEEIYADHYLNTFSTFVGSFYKDMGFYKTFLLALLFNLCAKISFQYTREPFTFTKTIVLVILFQIFLNGLFYYMYSGTTAMRSIILIIIFAICVQLFFRKLRPTHI